MPRVLVKGIEAEKRRAHPREFALLFQLAGGDEANAEVGLEASSTKYVSLICQKIKPVRIAGSNQRI